MSTLLVVAAHPDDEILGPGATVARHVRGGGIAHAVIVSEGATSRYSGSEDFALRAAARRAAEVIGFTTVDFLDLPDQRLDVEPLIDITQAVEQIVDARRPETVMTHFPHDVNLDHHRVSRAVWTACRPYAAPYVRRILGFETPSSTEWAWPLSGTAFQPQVFADVTDTLEQKIEAMAQYETEVRDYPHPRSLRALRERAGYWGSVSGLHAAEPFVLMRSRE